MVFFIQRPVGWHSFNRHDDVMVVQRLLNLAAKHEKPMGVHLDVNGEFDMITRKRLLKFMRRHSCYSSKWPMVTPGNEVYKDLVRGAIGPHRNWERWWPWIWRSNMTFPQFLDAIDARDLLENNIVSVLSRISRNVLSSKMGAAEVGKGVLLAMELAEINTPYRKAAFLGQVATETDGFKTLEEYASGNDYENRADLGNFRPGDGRRFKGRGYIQLTGRANYTKVWDEIGGPFRSNPAPTIQAEYLKVFPKGQAKFAPIDVANPEYAQTNDGGARTAAHYWTAHRINDLCDALAKAGAGEQAQYLKISKAVNNPHGTPNHADKRWSYYIAAKKALGI